jgi:plastocyanin
MPPFPRLLCPAFAAALLLSPAPGLAASGQVRVEIKDPKGAAVADAVASLVPLDAPAKPVPPAEPVLITQVDQEFQPYVTAVPVGARVNFPNRDHVQHHVYSLSKTKAFDIPLYRGESKEIIVFEQPGVVTIGCNIHDWMSAHIVVLATPYFAKSGTDGLVPLQGLPAGRYRLEVWHPRIAAMLTREVTVSAADTATQVIAVTLRPDRRIRRAPEAGGGAYK